MILVLRYCQRKISIPWAQRPHIISSACTKASSPLNKSIVLRQGAGEPCVIHNHLSTWEGGASLMLVCDDAIFLFGSLSLFLFCVLLFCLFSLCLYPSLLL